jgi:glutamate carboxypeptidase
MNTTGVGRNFIRSALMLALAALTAHAIAAPLEPVLALAGKEKAPLLETLKDLVSIESGSGDREGLDKIANLINADEEVSSAGSRSQLINLGGEHDAVFSLEGSRVESDRLSLTTAGIAAVVLHVQGRASHAGIAPENGRNALYELAYQVLQTRDLSDPATGLKMNWTVASAGTNRNVIPAVASATADVRVLRIADYDGIEQKVKERIKKQLIPDTKIEMIFERRRPPLELTPANQALAKHAQRIYSELGKDLVVGEVAEGGGTDAAFAALKTGRLMQSPMGPRRCLAG